jgi:nitroimidazol reductase NimA-like FMN-containing flavoprotein (pyridoxamine 5'-phosphate oxidase superfamily)
MGFRDLNDEEIEAVLAAQRVVRLGFVSGDEQYVVPVFYTWYKGALCGLTTPGRKTRLAAANPTVAFQLDSSAESGPWEWSSVSGQGAWEEVPNPAEFGPFAGQLRERLAGAPPWAQQLLQERFATIGMVPWRIRPTGMSGRTHEPG